MRLGDEQAMADRETFLADVVTTAVEGGIQYYASVEEYRWYSPDLDGGTAEPAPHGGGNAWAAFVVLENLDLPREQWRTWDLTPKTIAAAFNLLMADDYHPSDMSTGMSVVIDLKSWIETPVGLGALPSCEWRDRVLRARRENDAGELDADDADMLVQLGLWGAVVFG